MKQKKTTNISVKIILIFLACFFGTSFLSTGIVFAITRTLDASSTGMRYWALFGVPVITLTTLVLIGFLLNRLIVTRLKKLEEGMAQVVKGDFDVQVEEKGNDEITQLTSHFNQMTRELKANANLSNEFTRTVSHEFKTPLAVVRGYAERIDATTKEPASKADIEEILSEVDHLSALSKNLLELSKLDSQAILPQQDTIVAAKDIRSLLQATQLAWEEKNLQLDLTLDDFMMVTNQELLYRVFQNLLSNAIKFSPEGGTLSLSLKHSDKEVVFAIRNQGEPIPEEDKDKIFTLFYVGDPSRNKQGSGLGLSLCHKIVTRLGGTLVFDSKKEEGTQFTMTLPYQAPQKA